MSLAEAPEAPEVGTQATNEEKIIAWRKEELIRAGYNEIHAKRIAERYLAGHPDYIDLHYAIEMITPREQGGKGAPPHLAAELVL